MLLLTIISVWAACVTTAGKVLVLYFLVCNFVVNSEWFAHAQYYNALWNRIIIKILIKNRAIFIGQTCENDFKKYETAQLIWRMMIRSVYLSLKFRCLYFATTSIRSLYLWYNIIILLVYSLRLNLHTYSGRGRELTTPRFADHLSFVINIICAVK